MYKVGDLVLIKENCIYEELRGKRGTVVSNRRGGYDYPLVIEVFDSFGATNYRYSLSEVAPLHSSPSKTWDFEF